jgi:hypothetical protein
MPMPANRQSVKRLSRLSLAAAVLLAVAASILMLYFVAYVTMASRSINPAMDFMVYEYEWQEYFFRPAARLESLIRQKDVDTAHTAF